MFNWIKHNILSSRKRVNSSFDKTFYFLLDFGSYNSDESAKKAYLLLKEINSKTSITDINLLSTELNKIRYVSNTNGYYHFYFPIVAHVLFYVPKLESKILHQIIAPNYANGINDVNEMINMIISSTRNMLKQNKFYLSEEGRKLFEDGFQSLKTEIIREIEDCKSK